MSGSGGGSAPPGRSRDDHRNDVGKQCSAIQSIFESMEMGDAFDSVDGSRSCTPKPTPRLDEAFEKSQRWTKRRESDRTLRRWFNFFMMYGITPAEARQEKARGLSRTKKRPRHGSSRASPWTSQDTQILKEIVEEDPDLYLDEIQEAFCERTNSYWSDTDLWDRLHDCLGYTVKESVEKAKKCDSEEREEHQGYLDRLLSLGHSPLVYVDLSASGRNAYRHRRTWFRRWRPPFRDAYFTDYDGKRYSMLAACDVNGFIFETCETSIERDAGFSSDDNGTTVTDDRAWFRAWVENKLVPILGKIAQLEDRCFVVVDSGSVHVSDDVVDLIESAGAKLVYLPPHAHDLNPLQMMFGHYKAYLERHRQRHRLWVDAHIQALLSVDAGRARNCFRMCNVPRCEALERADESLREVAEGCALIAAAVATVARSIVN